MKLYIWDSRGQTHYFDAIEAALHAPWVVLSRYLLESLSCCKDCFTASCLLDKASWNAATSPVDRVLSLPAKSIPNYCCTPTGKLSFTKQFPSSKVPAHEAAAAHQACTTSLCTHHTRLCNMLRADKMVAAMWATDTPNRCGLAVDRHAC